MLSQYAAKERRAASAPAPSGSARNGYVKPLKIFSATTAPAEHAGHGRGLGRKHGARAHRQQPQDQRIAPVGQHRIPRQHGEQAGNRHGGGHQEIQLAQERRVMRSGAGAQILRAHHHHEGEVERGQHGGELHQQLFDLALRGEHVQIDDAAQKIAVEDQKLAAFAGHLRLHALAGTAG